MTNSSKDELQFNAFEGRWLPLVQENGTTEWASPIEVLCGEKDGVDLDYPRDDFRVYARLLLSALVQAVFPAANKQELNARLDTPLLRTDVEKRLKPLRKDFDLFGPTPFLQVVPPAAMPKSDGAAPFVFPHEDLFRGGLETSAVSLPTALIVLFAEQTFAGGAGRGYGAGPGGQPGALTLIDPGTVRQGAWANTLTVDTVEGIYAKDDKRPWTNEFLPPRPRAAIGIVGGLLFQVRSIWLVPDGMGRCSCSGLEGPLFHTSPLLPKSQLAKKAAGKEDLWRHPCSPLAVNSQGIGVIRLNPAQPAWTGLAQLLDPLSRETKKKHHPAEGPAPVLMQWRQLACRSRRPRLIVLDFERDKATIRQRFFESYPLTACLLEKDTIEHLRMVLKDAQDVQRSLERALTKAHDDRKQGGLALPDAEATFWVLSEPPFLQWLAVATSSNAEDEPDDDAILKAHVKMSEQIRKVAMGLFDSHVSISEFEPRKQKRIAEARSQLLRALFTTSRHNGARVHATEAHQ